MRATNVEIHRLANTLLCAAALTLCSVVSAQEAATAPANAPANAPATAATNSSSDQNVPVATVRKQAAEVAAGGPARWSQEDTTPAARLETLRKEAGAALQESMGNCRTSPKAERAACVKQARDTYRQDMAGAKAQSMAAQ
jgi:hypothetical protein